MSETTSNNGGDNHSLIEDGAIGTTFILLLFLSGGY